MAHMEQLQRQMESRTAPNTPTAQVPNEDGGWSAPTTPSLGMYEEEHGQHSKKSVIAKVKEKAKKLKQSLSKKKHNHDDNTTPTWGVKLEDEDDDHDHNQAEEPQYLAAHKMAPVVCKESSRQHKRVNPLVSDKHVVANNVIAHSEEEHHEGEILEDAKNKSISQAMINKVGPTWAISSEATDLITSNADHTNASSPGGSAFSGPQEHLWDKGLSVKEYLMHKLEPGEDEKALSQVITEVINPSSPRTDLPAGNDHEAGMVEKVRGVVSSLLWSNNDSSSSVLKATTANNASTDTTVSINAHTAPEEEKNKARKLQAN